MSKELLIKFLDEDKTWEWLHENGIISKERNCPDCHKQMKYVKNTTSQRRFRCRPCRRSITVREGTPFQCSRLSMSELMLILLFWWIHMDQLQCLFLCGASVNAVGDWYRICRRACEFHLLMHQQMIGGVGKVVEIDEAIWRRRKYGKGRRKVQLWIFGMIERSSEEEKGKVLLFLVYRRTRNVLLPIIKRHVHAGTEIHSDEWKAYSTLSDNGFVHKTVNHSRRFKDRFTKACTNVIEGTWSRMRRFMPMHGVREAHIAEYLASYVYVKHLKPSFIDFCKVVCEYSDSEYVKAVEAIDDGEEDDDDDEEIEDDVENFDEEESSSTEDEGSEMDAGDGADASEWEELDIDHEKRKR